jgi:hypothetical protein
MAASMVNVPEASQLQATVTEAKLRGKPVFAYNSLCPVLMWRQQCQSYSCKAGFVASAFARDFYLQSHSGLLGSECDTFKHYYSQLILWYHSQ